MNSRVGSWSRATPLCGSSTALSHVSLPGVVIRVRQPWWGVEFTHSSIHSYFLQIEDNVWGGLGRPHFVVRPPVEATSGLHMCHLPVGAEPAVGLQCSVGVDHTGRSGASATKGPERLSQGTTSLSIYLILSLFYLTAFVSEKENNQSSSVTWQASTASHFGGLPELNSTQADNRIDWVIVWWLLRGWKIAMDGWAVGWTDWHLAKWL